MYTANDLAKRWKMSERTIRELIAKGVVRSTRFGRLVRIPEEAIVEIEAVGIERIFGAR